MDPVTHGLVGAAAGLSISSASQRKGLLGASVGSDALERRWAVALCGLIAGELPDADRIIDLFFNQFGEDGRGLSYMLYHRGPTHTVLACLVAAPLLALLTRAIARRVRLPFWQLVSIAGTGLLLHLAMDGMNDYGIHPFPPLSQRWFYGDFLFLGEPTLWAALLPYILSMLGVRPHQLIAVCAVLGVLIFPALVLMKQWLMPLGAVIALLCLVVQASLQRHGPRSVIAWTSVALVLIVFFSASRFARAQALSWTAQLAPREHVIEVVTTPAPANPFCWRVITVTRDGDSFVARMGMLSFSRFVDATTCYSPPKGILPRSACGLILCRPLLANVRQFAEFSGSFSAFERLAENPRVGATRHFLRVPFWGLDARSNTCNAPSNLDHGAQNICAKAAVSPAHRPCPQPSRLLIGDLRVDYDKDDVGEFCKYPFSDPGKESYDDRWPVAEPRFFPDGARPR